MPLFEFLRSCSFRATRTLARVAVAMVALGAVVRVNARAAAPAAAGRPPNVILILADDLALGDLACFNGGRNRTPNLDRLVSESVWFNRGYSASPVCAPARAALMTGRYPHRTGVVSLNMETEPALTRLRADEVTLADLFAARGYTTGLVGKWHLGTGDECHPRRRGFSEFEGFVGAEMIPSYSSYELEVAGARKKFEGRDLTEELSQRAIEFVRRHRERPFFLHLAHYAPHRPLGAPEPLVAAYEARGLPRKIATVYAMIELMDRGIGELLETLRTLGLREKTLVIFASDNGPDPLVGERFNLQRRGAKYDVHEGGIRVPFLVAWPGTLRPRSTEAVAHFTDVVPTLVELCGLERRSPLPLDGTSLAGVLLEREAAPTERARFWQWNRGVPNYTHNAAMLEGEWKLVRPPVTHGAIAGDSVQAPMLFNVATEPTEATDLAAQHPARYERMRAALDRWSRDVERERTREGRP